MTGKTNYDTTETRELGDAFAVVGTGTGVGKTFVTAGLVGWLRDAGRDARAVKPAQTGFPPDDDAAVVTSACGTDEAAACLRRLEPALAPSVAADVVDEELDYRAIREESAAALAEADPGVMEGIGGLRVPLADGREVLDLVADLGIPAVVVARSGLGTLNHTALSVSALRRRDVDVSAIVLNEYEGDSLAERTNPDVLAEMTDCPVHTLPSLAQDTPSGAVTAVREHLPRDVFPRGSSPTDSGNPSTPTADSGNPSTSTADLFNVRMRAAEDGDHVSGAETIAASGDVAEAARTMLSRALDHTRGDPDDVTVTVDRLSADPLRVAALPVVTVDAADVDTGHRVARRLLEEAGVSSAAIDRGFDVLRSTTAERGAALVDATDGTRLDPDRARGVRTSCLGTSERGESELDAALAEHELASTRIRDALVLATKVLQTPGIVAELCWSDNPDYTAGYVATRHGYYRFPALKREGDARGGRAFFLQSDAAVEQTVEFLEERPVLVDDVQTFERLAPTKVLAATDGSPATGKRR